MRSRIAGWWSFLSGMGHFSHEAGAAMFQVLRIRLTLWYCGVLALALLFFGLALYFGAQYSLLQPVEAAAKGSADAHVGMWLQGRPSVCQPPPDNSNTSQDNPPPQGFLKSMGEIVVCFDANGNVISSQPFPPALLSNNLVKNTLQMGQSAPADIVSGKNGRWYRYAEVVQDRPGGNVLGVVVVAQSLGVQDNVLSLLLMLLLSVGSIALLAAAAGGLFLARRALAPARLAWERQQRFIGDASHELRTPLTLLRADAEVLLRSRKRMDPDDADLLEDMVEETNHMAHLLNNMLTLARLDDRSEHQEYEVVELAEVTRASVRRVQALASQRGIDIQVEANEAAVVIGDSTQLEQATLALLDNAIKYNHAGGQIAVRAAVKGKQVVLEVADTGIGIASEHLSHLGERFYRVDKARSRRAGGTGLGLSIVQGIAAAHGGTLELKSVPEQRTTATITLPLAQSAQHGHDPQADDGMEQSQHMK